MRNYKIFPEKMTRLSVNINKIATLRNARGGNTPNLLQCALDLEKFGAEGITVHPRPDERHIRRDDVLELSGKLSTEFNIEGYPDERFIQLVTQVRPAQVTLVPDSPEQLTSNHGWDTLQNIDFLRKVTRIFQDCGIRVSIFVDPDARMVEEAKACGADRVELYTEPYASKYPENPEAAVAPFVTAAEKAKELGLGLNAGHDLSLENLRYFRQRIPWLDEVSIGHAIISDALYLGMETTVKRYLEELADR